ncbi:hypothetical protein L560_2255 [Bordetella pertussis STO1-CHOC-0018]|nr:hypothetical protein L560_2255 [Bordetella pertussis STO1-CHOC-0018]
MVDDARGHEERGLEGGVVDHVEDRRHQAERAVQAQHERDQPQVADGRIGQHPFHVLLENRRVGAQHQRAQAGAADDPEPFVGTRQHGPEARQQENARLDHGGRMQIGRHRRGRGHGVGQPELERELGALGQRAQRDQDQHRRIPGVGAHDIARGQHLVHVVAADDVAEHQHAGQQAQAAGAGDRQGHARAAPGVEPVVPIGDQHERGQAGHFPEHDQLDQVAGHHHAQHGGHERLEEREKARHRVFRRHVVARIQHDQRAHARDDQREQPGIAVHAQGELQPQRRRPRQVGADHAAGGDLGIEAGHQQGAGQGDQASQPGFRIAGIGRQQSGTQTAEKRQGEY